MEDNAASIERIIHSLLAGEVSKAHRLAEKGLPFEPLLIAGRRYRLTEAMRIFVRDGFIDRYSGDRMIFPGILRLLAVSLPEAFPFQEHWKMSQTHMIYWHLFPTLDHIVPISRGGSDTEGNLVCTSMLKNSAKANWTLEELGWQLHPPGRFEEWDGLTHLFIGFTERKPEMLSTRYLKSWHKAAIAVLDRNCETARRG